MLAACAPTAPPTATAPPAAAKPTDVPKPAAAATQPAPDGSSPFTANGKLGCNPAETP